MYVLDGENKVQYRPVTTGGIVGSRQIILSGLQEGETVVVDGTHKVMPGQAVNPIPVKEPTAKTAAPAASSGGKK